MNHFTENQTSLPSTTPSDPILPLDPIESINQIEANLSSSIAENVSSSSDFDAQDIGQLSPEVEFSWPSSGANDPYVNPADTIPNNSEFEMMPLSGLPSSSSESSADRQDGAENTPSQSMVPPLELPNDTEACPDVRWFAQDSTEEPTSPQVPSSPLPVAIINQTYPSQDDGPLFDVRDFSDVAGQKTELTPGAYKSNSVQIQSSLESTVSETDDLNTHAEEIRQTEVPKFVSNQVFIAEEGDEISVDGNEGYDHIDLACFDVQFAEFGPGVITIRDPNSYTFKVRYQNVDYALFDSGVKVDLNATED